MPDFSSLPTAIYIAIPIIVFALWFSLRRKNQKQQSSYINNDYFKGLNYLLNDEQGKALDIFVKLVESNWDIIDTHFALGSIFRKNGETDKAIKIHQGLMARPSLPEKYRSKVLLELGYDYLGAGWFDRAEGLFKEVLIHDKQSVEARHNLILIFQQEKDWNKAIDTAVDLFRENPSEIGPLIAQYYCELAEIAEIKGDVIQVENNANQALSHDTNCVRASFLLSSQFIEKGDHKAAIRVLEQVEKQDPEFLPLIIEPLIECYHQLQKSEELLSYLEGLENKYDDVFLLEKNVVAIDRYKGKEAASNYLLSKLRKQPSMQGLYLLLDLKSASADFSSTDNTLQPLLKDMKTAVKKMHADHVDYQCRHCGFHTNTLYWLCPTCHSWSQVKPSLVEKL